MKIKITLLAMLSLLTGCGTFTPTQRPSPVVLTTPPPQEVMAPQAAPPPSPGTASGSLTTPMPSPTTKWKTYAVVVRQNQGAAAQLDAVDGFQSRDMHAKMGGVPIAPLACTDTPTNPNPGYYSSVMFLGMSPAALNGVVRINHALYQITEKNVISRSGSTVNLKFSVRVCNGEGKIAVPMEYVAGGQWALPNCTIWWMVPPAFRTQISRPISDGLKTCSGRGDDADICGKQLVDQYGECYRESWRDSVSVFVFRSP